MNGLLVIVVGVFILYMVISGKLDCFIKALQACNGAAAPGTAAGTVTGAAPAAATPKATLDKVLSPAVGI